MSTVKKFLSLIITAVIVLTQLAVSFKNVSFSGSVLAAENTAVAEKSYSDYLKGLRGVTPGTDFFEFDVDDFSDKNGNPYSATDIFDAQEGAVLESGDSIGVSFEIIDTGFYYIDFDYYALPGRGINIVYSFCVDEKFPFKDTAALELSRMWRDNPDTSDDSTFEKDANGDEIIPLQTEYYGWQLSQLELIDYSGDERTKIFLKKGKHTVDISVLQESFAVKKIRIHGKGDVPDYSEYIALNSDKKQSGNDSWFKVEAEKSYLKSSNGMSPYYDRSTPEVTPNDPVNIKVNAIGGYNWRNKNDWISWIIDVPADGFYTLSVHYQQSFKRGMSSVRALYIDGQLLFSELANISFPYSGKWRSITLSDSNKEPFKIFLTEGKHELKLTAKLGDVAPILNSLSTTIANLNSVYRSIIMITGTNPDPNRDYYLDSEIPDLIPRLQTASDMLDKQSGSFIELTKNKGSEASFLNVVKMMVDEFLLDPRKIPKNLPTFQSNVASLADIMLNMKNQPLAIDYFIFSSTDNPHVASKTSIFQRISFRMRIFLQSFLVDYSRLAHVDASGSKEIDVWLSTSDIGSGVAVGREQAQLIQKLISTGFTPESDVSVRLSLVNSMGALIQSILSGTNPDVVMFNGKSTPVTLAVRGAADDLSKYEGFDEIKEWFHPSSLISFAFNDGIYALPEIQFFYLMFYRKDILAEMGLQIPETWEDFYSITKKLQQNNLEVGISGSDQMIFEMLLLQYDGQMYNQNLSKTLLTEVNAITAFDKWTQLYTNYGMNVAFDFLSRFRSGQMPLGIMPLTMYNTLSAAAPEINNLWAIAPIPGVMKDNGYIDRTQTCSTTGSVILTEAQNKTDCFDFLKWWVSEETQTAFGVQTEAALGAASRYFTANKAAFYSMPWSIDEIETLDDQWAYITDIAQTPANYYVSRSIANAFRKVVYYRENPREVMTKYAAQIDEELARKRREFGLD